MSNSQKLVATAPPHLKAENTVSQAMRDVIIALIPVSLVAIYFFTFYAIITFAVCLGTAALTEIVFRRVAGKKHTLNDLSALLTGLLVALLLPATAPWWTAALATLIAVGVAKEIMGGLGWNLFNPALFGRVVVLVLAPWFAFMNTGFAGLSINVGNVDVYTQATPLAMMQGGMEMPGYGSMFLAFPGGAMGETSALALLLGAAFLIYKKHIGWRIPVSIIATVFVLSLITGQDPIYHVLAGGVLLGAFYMATDWVTSPITDKGKIIFGIAIGVLIIVFRVGFGPTEGVAFSILIMNGFVPLIERVTKRPSFSEPKPTTARTSAQTASAGKS